MVLPSLEFDLMEGCMTKNSIETGDGSVSRRFDPPMSWRMCVALAVAATVFAIDHIVKMLVRGTIALTGESVSVVPGLLSFRFVANIGAAFSLGEGMGLLFALFAIVVVLSIFAYLLRTPLVSKVETLGLGLLAGGALGNAFDRLTLGYVVDFIATDFIDFPVFNIADVAICVGVVLAFIGFMFLSPAAKVDAGAVLDERDRRAASRRAGRRRGAARGKDGR